MISILALINIFLLFFYFRNISSIGLLSSDLQQQHQYQRSHFSSISDTIANTPIITNIRACHALVNDMTLKLKSWEPCSNPLSNEPCSSGKHNLEHASVDVHQLSKELCCLSCKYDLERASMDDIFLEKNKKSKARGNLDEQITKQFKMESKNEIAKSLLLRNGSANKIDNINNSNIGLDLKNKISEKKTQIELYTLTQKLDHYKQQQKLKQTLQDKSNENKSDIITEEIITSIMHHPVDFCFSPAVNTIEDDSSTNVNENNILSCKELEEIALVRICHSDLKEAGICPLTKDEDTEDYIKRKLLVEKSCPVKKPSPVFFNPEYFDNKYDNFSSTWKNIIYFQKLSLYIEHHRVILQNFTDQETRDFFSSNRK